MRIANEAGIPVVVDFDVPRSDAIPTLGEAAELEEVSWVAGTPPPGGLDARVQVRHRHEPAPARIESLAHGRARVRFAEPVRAVAPGQAAVFYDGDVVLGGGWITQSLQ